MVKNYIPNIGGVADFMEFHAKHWGAILMCYDKLQPAFCLYNRMNSRYRFPDPSVRHEIEAFIKENRYFFDVEETNLFYWPNTVFGGDNSERGIPGEILRIKPYYLNQWSPNCGWGRMEEAPDEHED